VAANQLLLVVTENWEGRLRRLHSIITMTFQVDGACFFLKLKSDNIGFVRHQLDRNGMETLRLEWFYVPLKVSISDNHNNIATKSQPFHA